MKEYPDYEEVTFSDIEGTDDEDYGSQQSEIHQDQHRFLLLCGSYHQEDLRHEAVQGHGA